MEKACLCVAGSPLPQPKLDHINYHVVASHVVSSVILDMTTFLAVAINKITFVHLF